MKSAKFLLILPLALSGLLHGQSIATLEVSYVKDRPAKSATRPAAYFLGTEVGYSQSSGVTPDDGLSAAYQAIAAARARIQSNRICQRFFHDEGEQVLEQTRFSMQYLRIPEVAAQVSGTVVFINLSPTGAFMRPPLRLIKLTDPAEIRAFYILHELAHELCRYTRYVDDHKASAAWQGTHSPGCSDSALPRFCSARAPLNMTRGGEH